MQAELKPAVFAQRRAELLAQLPAQSAVVLFAPEEAQRNNDVYYPFRQESYFWYLTGFPEPNAVALLLKTDSDSRYILFNAPRHPDKEIWEGKIIGQEGAKTHYGADESHPLDELHRLSSYVANSQRLYTVLGTQTANDERISALLRQAHTQAGRGGAPIAGIFDIRRQLDEMRMFKAKAEQALLHRAGQISAQGHRAAMQAAAPGRYEYQVQAVLEATFKDHGCDWSFPSIVASGANACCLHYRDNHAKLKDGELLMVDAGAEFAGYAGDISRTMPINGKFSREQHALYEVVLQAQKQAIDAARPGIRHLELHDLTTRTLMQGMIDLGIITGRVEDWMSEERFKQFYMHGTGHWLGLDVHDVGVYKPDGQSRAYQPGMVVTIEPGLYIQRDDTSVDEKWRGIGIRIEDDIIITDGEPDVTTADVPKDVDEIEALMAE